MKSKIGNQLKKINEPKFQLFGKLNKIDKPPTKLNKKKGAKTQMIIRNEKGDITTDPTLYFIIYLIGWNLGTWLYRAARKTGK